MIWFLAGMVLMLLLYSAGFLCTWVWQDRFIFRPKRMPRVLPPVTEGETERFFEIGAMRIHAFHWRRTGAKGVVLYFHGNAGDLRKWRGIAETFTQRGWDLLIPDYPGFGKSRGPLSEAGIHTLAATLYEELRKEWPAEQIIIMGRSMGTGPATRLASTHPALALLLETPYASLPSLFRRYYPFLPPVFFFRFQFRSIDVIGQVQCPIHIFHGTRDRVVPLGEARKLHRAAPQGTQLLILPGGKHNDLRRFPAYQQAMDAVLGTGTPA